MSTRRNGYATIALRGFFTVQHLRLKASEKLPVVMVGTGLAETLGLTRKETAKLIGARP
jgi:hypothetical protein